MIPSKTPWRSCRFDCRTCRVDSLNCDEERSIRTKIEHLKEAGARGAIWRDKISSALKGNAGTAGIAEAVANVLVEEKYDDIDVLKALDVATCRTILRINGITAPFGLVQRIVDGIRAFV